MKSILNGAKIVAISIIECIIIFNSATILGNIFSFVAEKVDPELWFGEFYKNIYTLIAMIFGYIIIGLALFILFKLVELFLISKHKPDSYQYMILPCILILLVGLGFEWVVDGYFTDIIVVSYIFLPIVAVIMSLNIIYEFRFMKRKMITKIK
jgi:hypothetical protein